MSSPPPRESGGARADGPTARRRPARGGSGAFTALFAGGALGKLASALLAERLGVIRTVILVAARCRLTFDRRLLPGETFEQAEAEIREVIERVQARDPERWTFELTRTLAVPALEIDPGARIVRECQRAYRDVTGEESGINLLRVDLYEELLLLRRLYHGGFRPSGRRHDGGIRDQRSFSGWAPCDRHPEDLRVPLGGARRDITAGANPFRKRLSSEKCRAPYYGQRGLLVLDELGLPLLRRPRR